MATPQSLEHLIAHTLLEVLTEACITSVPKDDRSRVNVVKVGKPAEELKQKNLVSIFTVHPLGPGRDEGEIWMGTPTKPNERPEKWPVETVGGMRTDKMIGAVQINVRQNLKAEDAINVVGAITFRVTQAINRDPRLRTLTDDFGDFMSSITTFKRYGYESGGGMTSLYRRWIDWRARTHTPNSRVGEATYDRTSTSQ